MSLSDAPGAPPDETDKIMLSDLPESRKVTTYFLCSEKEVATARTGGAFLRLKLRDASGEIKAIHFDPSPENLEQLEAGDVVKVEGMIQTSPQFGQQFKVERLRRMQADEYDAAALVAVSPVQLDELQERLRALVESVVSAPVRALLERAVDPSSEPGAAFAIAPAAVMNHHAYRHGLLEHSIIVAEVAGEVASHFAGGDRDLVVAGALLHDIGKTQAYSTDPFAPGFTDTGRLHGEIVIGHDMVAALIAEVPDFPAEPAAQLRHIIVAHHGQKEKGSPVIPMTREAIIVHFCDDMTARVGAFDEIERASDGRERWSAFNRMLDTRAYLGPRDGGD